MLTVYTPPTHLAEREYAVRVLLEEFLGHELVFRTEERSDTEIRVAGDDRRALSLADGLFAVPDDDWLTTRSLPSSPLRRFQLSGTPFAAHPATEVAVLYGSPTWEQDAETLRLGIDILGGSFFMLTRYEEAVLDVRDRHDRFRGEAMILRAEGISRRPLVNEYLELLWLALRTLWPNLERRALQFTVAPSHDVDWPLSSEGTVWQLARRAVGDLAKGRDPPAAGRRVRGYAARRAGRLDLDVNNTFDELMDCAERLGLRSAFYFMADHRAGRSVDGDYSLDDPWIRGLLRRIHARGHEIGLHASYTTPTDEEQTRRERDILVRVLDEEGIPWSRLGGRQHFLRWRNPITWRNWDRAGLDYDSTLGFADDIGFRAGVCLEYPVFDLEARVQLGLRELPLAVMEGAALDRLGLGHEAAAEAIAEVRETCRRYGGTFTLLWHNSRFVHRADRRLYLEALGG
jgi:hypothetical protein